MLQHTALLYASTFPLVFMAYATSNPNPQEEALLQWKASLADANSLSSWSPTGNSTCCSWLGVTCDAEGHVAELSLPSAGLRGQLESFDFAAFPNLTKLNLNNNSLVGDIPFRFSKLPNIVWLDLGSNYLSSPDYSRMSPMPTLEHISMWGNKLDGMFPEFILSCTKLIFLDLQGMISMGQYQIHWPR
ncbi:LRR receptor-like serine/threonine-protein kinase FLS2 [Panicum miliaceum]|uniref:LRR receptor-like serine/threonine-protein kinase FLS2 n=1 Tax=Panicum miliaceum TaxID=4540 RepID=A0A3L6TSD0_PANMI|nr:LRR receptor-like serine/threonine-protein kinase FLS2 [Panicum miliaceum]